MFTYNQAKKIYIEGLAVGNACGLGIGDTEYFDEMLERTNILNKNNYNMKYRVNFKCYWYNTGAADNHTYIKHEDFDTEEEAIIFKQRVDARDKTIEIENGFIDGDGEIVRYYPAREEPI